MRGRHRQPPNSSDSVVNGGSALVNASTLRPACVTVRSGLTMATPAPAFRSHRSSPFPGIDMTAAPRRLSSSVSHDKAMSANRFPISSSS